MQTITVDEKLYSRANGLNSIAAVREMANGTPSIVAKKRTIISIPKPLRTDGVKTALDRMRYGVTASPAVLKGKEVKPITPEKVEAMIATAAPVNKVLQAIEQRSPERAELKKSFDMLKPLAPVMASAVRSVGLCPKKDIDQLSEQLYNEVIRKSSRTAVSNFDYEYPEVKMATMYADSVDDAKDVVIGAVLDFVNIARTKKQAGQPMTKVEEIMASGADSVERNLTEAAKAEAATQVGNKLLFDKKTQLILLGVVVVIMVIVARVF